MTEWLHPDNRREAFQRSYTFSLETKTFPGMVYSMLPALAESFGLDEDGQAWLAWLNGNTQNVVTSMLLLEAAPRWQDWRKAVDFYNEHFKLLEWDTDRRHQKSKFGVAREQWIAGLADTGDSPRSVWDFDTGKAAFAYAMSQPYMGRISAWSYKQFAPILLGPGTVPDVDSWYLEEASSRSHRNALCLLKGGGDAGGGDGEQAEIPFLRGILPELHDLAEDLLDEAYRRNAWVNHDRHPLVARLTLESALCTYKSWHKPNRRYPNVYADMMYQRIKKAEARFGRGMDLLWHIRQRTLPTPLRLEDNPGDPGLSPVKQNWYREIGEIHYLHMYFPAMEPSGFERAVEAGESGQRKDPTWT